MLRVDYLAQRYIGKVVSICCDMLNSRKNQGSRLTTRDPDRDLAASTIFVLIILAIAGFVIVGSVQYTSKLLLTLVVVEDPAPLYLPTDNSADDAPPNSEGRYFITSSIRKILRHLRREAGPFSPWRGMGANICFSIANSFLRIVLTKVLAVLYLPFYVAFPIGGVISMVLVSRFALAVTHIMISAPVPGKSWHRRVLDTPWSSAVKTIPALLIFSTCVEAVSGLSQVASNIFASPMAYTLIFFAFCLGYILLVIPAHIVLVRVQASTLPDDVATIVPFDKTFGQDISLTNDALTVRGALKSIDWALMKRTLFFLAKIVPIVVAISAVYVAFLSYLLFSLPHPH